MKENNLILRNCRYVLTFSPEGDLRLLENIDILVENGVITNIGKGLSKPRGFEEIDAGKHIVIPGFINAHTHAAMVVFRGYADDYELFDWLRKVWRAEERLDREIIYLATKVACYEMLLSGITGFIDMYPYYEEVVKAAKEIGLRVATGPICGFDEYLDIQDLDYKHYVPLINVHSLYALPIDEVIKCFDHASKRNFIVHIHVSETRKEVFEIKSRTGKFPVELMDSLGILNEKTLLVHLNWVTSWEVNIISLRKAKVAVCPTSSMKLANSGFTPILEFDSKDVAVGLGTDGACSANRLDMIEEMRQLILLYRHNYWDVRVGAKEAFKFATVNGFKILNIRGGIIAPGYKADLVAISLKSPWLRPILNPLSLVVYSACRSDVDYVIIEGRPTLTPELKEEIMYRANELWNKLEPKISKLWV